MNKMTKTLDGEEFEFSISVEIFFFNFYWNIYNLDNVSQ